MEELYDYFEFWSIIDNLRKYISENTLKNEKPDEFNLFFKKVNLNNFQKFEKFKETFFVHYQVMKEKLQEFFEKSSKNIDNLNFSEKINSCLLQGYSFYYFNLLNPNYISELSHQLNLEGFIQFFNSKINSDIKSNSNLQIQIKKIVMNNLLLFGNINFFYSGMELITIPTKILDFFWDYLENFNWCELNDKEGIEKADFVLKNKLQEDFYEDQRVILKKIFLRYKMQIHRAFSWFLSEKTPDFLSEVAPLSDFEVDQIIKSGRKQFVNVILHPDFLLKNRQNDSQKEIMLDIFSLANEIIQDNEQISWIDLIDELLEPIYNEYDKKRLHIQVIKLYDSIKKFELIE